MNILGMPFKYWKVWNYRVVIRWYQFFIIFKLKLINWNSGYVDQKWNFDKKQKGLNYYWVKK